MFVLSYLCIDDEDYTNKLNAVFGNFIYKLGTAQQDQKKLVLRKEHKTPHKFFYSALVYVYLDSAYREQL